MNRIWLSLASVFAAMCFGAWVTDFVTLQGESTIYTVDCNGTWKDKRCEGTLTPGARYRFRALRVHEEVLFWRIGASGPSHKYSNCTIQDGRNWSCPANADAQHTVARELKRGLPVLDPATANQAYHGVPKWRWILLRYGISTGSSAD